MCIVHCESKKEAPSILPKRKEKNKTKIHEACDYYKSKFGETNQGLLFPFEDFRFLFGSPHDHQKLPCLFSLLIFPKELST